MDLLNKTENPDSSQVPATAPIISTELHPISKPELEAISGPVSNTPPASVPPPAFTITPVKTPSVDSHFANFITNSVPAESAQTPSVPTQTSAEPIVPVVPPPPVFSNQSGVKSRGSKKVLIFALSILIAILLLSAVAYAYLSSVSSKDIIKTLGMIDSSPKIHAELKFALDASDSKLAGSTFVIEGDADKSGQGIQAFQGKMDLKSPMYSVKGEFKYLGDKIYGMTVTVPKVPYYSDRLSSSTLKGITGIWYSLSLDKLKKIQENYYQATNTIDFSPKYKSLTSIYEKLDKEEVITKLKYSGLGKDSSGYVRRYTTTVNKDALRKVLSAATSDDINNIYYKLLKARAPYLLGLVDINPVTISVSLFGGRLSQVSFSLVPSENIKQQIKGLAGVDITLSYDESKNNFSIVAPEVAVSMDGYVEKQISEARLRADRARTQAYISNVRAGAEIYFDKGKSYAGLCTKDFNVKSNLAELSKSNVVTSCRSNAKAYMIAAKLPMISPATTTSYFCVDSTGLATALGKLPTGYACK